jgi:glutathione synthase/RimK-type ligase-like ATP-grasp enzyme
VFSKSWKFIQAGEFEEINELVKFDLIFNRDDKNTIPEIRDALVINHPDLDKLCVDKLATQKAFPDLSPFTAEINSYEEVTENIPKIKSSKIVLKKNFATEGRGIFIIEKEELKPELYDDWSNILLQEFIDNSVGIPGIVNGLHDIRICIINGNIINSFVRQPKEGSFLANIAQGGSGKSINFDEIPGELINLALKLDRQLEKYKPRIYAADFLNSPNGYRLMELNSRPAVQHPSWSKSYEIFNNALIEMLIEAVNGQSNT